MGLNTNLPASTNDLITASNQMIEAATNLPALTNVVGVATNSAASPEAWFCPSVGIVGLMFAGLLVGSIGSVCYERIKAADEESKERDDATKSGSAGPKRPGRDWLSSFAKTLGMGAAAVALVPAFLRTVSSNLINDAEQDFTSKLVLVAFCVAATLIAKKLIGTFPDQLFNLAKSADKKSADNERVSTTLAQVIANLQAEVTALRNGPRTEPPPGTQPPGTPPPPAGQSQQPAPETLRAPVPGVSGGGSASVSEADASRRTPASLQPLNPVIGYDHNDLLVIRGFLVPNYPDGRTNVGLAMDTGLSMGQVAGAIIQLSANGHIRRTDRQIRSLDLWELTPAGRNLFLDRFQPLQTAGLQ